MNHRWFILVLALAASVATAQQPSRDPRIAYVYPAGGQAGSTFTVTVGGQNLDHPVGILVTGGGVRAVVQEHFRPMNPGMAAPLGDRLRELRDKRQASRNLKDTTRPTWTDHDQEAMAALMKRMATLIRKPSSPAFSESVTLQVTIAPDAMPGNREIRLVTTERVTNPMLFCIGQLPEVTEKPSRIRDDPTQSVAADSYTVTQPCVVNGQIMSGGVDRYRFAARKGQELMVIVRARELIPYISDAVPGWFQATATLLDPKGREIAYDDDFQFNPDPVLHVKVPEDGEYTLVLHDAIYRGREDFIYRVAIGELPFVAGAFPLGATAGASVPVQLTGWNLPTYKLTLDASHHPAGCFPLFDFAPVRSGATTRPTAQPWTLQTVAVDAISDQPEKEPNNTVSAAQKVAVPTILNARLDTPGDVDVFRVEAKAGQQIIADVDGRRLGSPIDAAIDILDAGGKLLASGDDCEDKTAGLITHQADPRVPTTMPSDGVCYVRVHEVQARGGPAYAYRLKIAEASPDFDLRVAPSSVNLRGRNGGTVTVYALRRDGFKGDIELALEGAPPGIKLSATTIKADQTELKVTLSGHGKLPDGPLPLKLVGQATVAGTRMTRSAVAAEDMMQAFAYRHLVPASELLASTGGRSDVWAERNTANIVARYAGEQLGVPNQRMPRFISAYTAEREAAAVRLKLATDVEKPAVMEANRKMMYDVLEEILGPEEALDAPAVLGQGLCDLDMKLLPMTIAGQTREKLAAALPTIANRPTTRPK